MARPLERSADLGPSIVVEPLDAVDRGTTLTPVIPAALFELKTPGEDAAHWAIWHERPWHPGGGGAPVSPSAAAQLATRPRAASAARLIGAS